MFTYGLFKGDLNSPNCIASGSLVNNETKITWREAVVA
jgi:hypothetical protein